MPTTPLPAALRKRSEQYAQNIHKRGNVKKSLNPKVEQRLEAERLQKQGLRKGQPTLGATGRKAVVVLLLLMLGSGLYQVLQPLFAGFGRPSGPAPKTEADLTRDQQAQAAASVLQELNRKATAKYLKYAKDYKPPVPAPMAEPIVQLKAESKADVDDDDDDNVWAKPIVELKAESKADVDDNVWADAAHPAMEPLV